MIKIIILIVLITIIFYIINKNISSQKEHYLTYFLPYYDNRKQDLALLYENDENNTNWFENKFDYYLLRYGVIKNEKSFVTELLNNYLSTNNLVQAKRTFYKDWFLILDKILKKEIDIGISDYITLITFNENYGMDIDNIRLITNLYKLYIYIFTKKDYGIYSLSKIPTGAVIGIMNYPDPMHSYYRRFMKDLGYQENIDYTVKLYDTEDDLLNGLNNSECHFTLLRDTFPSKTIDDFLKHNASNNIILLPFDIDNEDVFLKKNSIFEIDYIDLNDLSPAYLPRKFGKYEYTVNRPTIKICATYKILLAHESLPNRYTYNFVKFYFKYYKELNKTLRDKGYTLDGVDVDVKINLLMYHNGVIDFYYDYGFLTNTDNENCKYLVGKMPCNETTLKANGFL